jgi:hypothetical protein
MKVNKKNSKEIRTKKKYHKNPKEMRRNQKKYNAIDNGGKSKRIKKSKEIQTNCARNDILTGRASASFDDGDFILETERSFHVRPKLHKARRLLMSQTRS